MSTLVTRAGKGSPLTHNEVDANFNNLNTDKIQSGNTVAALTITSATINGGSISGITDLAVADGGTGASTLTGVLKGNGTAAFTAATLGTDYSGGTSALGTGIIKSTTTTGALTIAVAADFPTLNQNTTGTASNVTGTVAIANGGTGQTTAADAFNALDPMTTTGDMIYASAANTAARLGVGSTGQVLTVAGGVPTWTAPAGGGKVLQVVSTTKIDVFSTSGTYNTWIDITGLSVSITPTSATSKVLVLFQTMGASTSNGWVRLVRGSTAISVGTTSGSRQAVSSGNMTTGNAAIQLQDSGVFLDSPATTSATTYKIQVITDTGTFYINQSQSDADNVYRGRGVSSITVMEIAA
jgi:hypothetical protein